MDKTDYVISYEEWIEDPINEDRSMRDYYNEVIFNDEKAEREWKLDLVKKAITEFSTLYLSFKRNNQNEKKKIVSGWLEELRKIKAYHESRLTS